MDTKCCGLFGKLFGHRFEARYDSEESEGKLPDQLTSVTIDAHYLVQIVEATRSIKETYIHDICTRCGETTNNSTPKESKKE